jgi:hypothetical protein
MHVQSNFSIEVNEGTVYDQRYYTAAPLEAGKEWPHMMAWMIETFGPSADNGVWTPNMRWYANNAKFWFRNQTDLTLFLLRWNR